jgi:hypothetical protein
MLLAVPDRLRQTDSQSRLWTSCKEHVIKTGKMSSVPEHMKFPHAIFADSEFWKLLPQIKEHHFMDNLRKSYHPYYPRYVKQQTVSDVKA